MAASHKNTPRNASTVAVPASVMSSALNPSNGSNSGPGLDAEQAAHQRLGQRSARRDEDRAVAEPAGVGEHELGSADRGAGQLLALAGERGPSQLDEHQDRGEATGQPQGERVDVTTRAVTAQVGCEERFGEREHHAEHEEP